MCNDTVVSNMQNKRIYAPSVCSCLLRLASVWWLHHAAMMRVVVSMREAGFLIRSSHFGSSRPGALLETYPSQSFRGTGRNLSAGTRGKEILDLHGLRVHAEELALLSLM